MQSLQRSHSSLQVRGVGVSAARRSHLKVLCTAQQQAPPDVIQQTHWLQKTITLPNHKRGCHVITHKITSQLPELTDFEVGLTNLFILHTSASLTINENASPDVPLDLNDALDKLVPEGSHYRHLDEGYDDMPAHVKSSLMGPSLTIPISKGRLALGTWQGVYLNEHRNHGGSGYHCDHSRPETNRWEEVWPVQLTEKMQEHSTLMNVCQCFTLGYSIDQGDLRRLGLYGCNGLRLIAN